MTGSAEHPPQGSTNLTPRGAKGLNRRPLRLVDVIIGIIGSVVSLIIFGVILFILVPQLTRGIGIVIAIITIIIWGLAEVLFIRAATRRKLSFYWPFVGTIAMVVALNVAIVVASGKA